LRLKLKYRHATFSLKVSKQVTTLTLFATIIEDKIHSHLLNFNHLIHAPTGK